MRKNFNTIGIFLRQEERMGLEAIGAVFGAIGAGAGVTGAGVTAGMSIAAGVGIVSAAAGAATSIYSATSGPDTPEFQRQEQLNVQAQANEEAKKDIKRRAGAVGKAATILTSPTGLLNAASTTRKTLLGE